MPRSRTLKWVGIVAGTLLALLIVLAVVLAFIDWNSMRGPISRVASARLGRPVQIQGDLDVHLFSWTPTISIAGLDVGNPAWAGGGSMAHAERVFMKVRLGSLLIGSLVLPELRIERPTAHLLRANDGRVNWASAPSGKEQGGKAPDLPVVQHFELQPGEITFKDVKRELEFKGIASANESMDGKDARPFELVGLGTMNGKSFRFNLRGAPLVNVRRDRPYPFDAEIVAGAMKVTARGSIPRPFDLATVRADFEMSGDDLADAYYISGIALPNTRPYRLSGRFARQGTVVAFQNLSGTVGDSDMRGNVSVDLKGERPLVSGKVVSQSLDLDDAATWFGAAPAAKGGEKASPRQKVAGQAAATAQRLFPDAKLKLARVRSMDAQFQYEAIAVRSGRFPIRAVVANVKLNDGVLRFDPVSLSLPQGKIEGTVQLDAREDVARTDMDAKLTGIRLEQFKSKKSPEAPLDGLLRGRVKLFGHGNSVHEFVSSSDGNLTFVVPKAEVREAFAELTGINVARGLGLLLSKDEDKANVRCGVADLKAKNGTMQVQNMVFDTDNVLITGKGGVSLQDEEFGLSIRGQPKKLRLLRVKSPIAIRGPLLKPAIRLEADPKAIGQTGVAAALGALVTPLAAVVAFVDPGLAKDADCASLLAEAKSEGAPVKTAEIENAPKR